MGDDLLELNSGQYQLWKFDAANSKWAIQSFNNQVDQSPPPDPSGQINPVTRPQTDTTAAEHDLALAEQRFSDLQLGNWSALLNYTIEELEHHHVREKLALYAGAAHIQSGQLEQGRELVNQAITWGIDRKLVARTLISGIHHNLGNAETVGGNERRAIHHYRHAAATIRPGHDATPSIHTRLQQQRSLLGLPPISRQRLNSDLHHGIHSQPAASPSTQQQNHQLLVFGMHRSGTSCLAGLLNTMGAYYSDDEHAMPIAVDNPKGFFERSDVCKLLQELLVSAGADWHRVCGLDARLPTVVATPPSPA